MIRTPGMRWLFLALIFELGLAGCAGIDPEAAKSLGTAGQNAAEALYNQAETARKTLIELPALTVVREDLLCTAAKDQKTGKTGGKAESDCLNNLIDPNKKVSALNEQRAQAARKLSTVVEKRANAALQLQKAYAAYVALASYDAGAQASAAIKNAFASINDLSKTISSVYPPAAVASSISPVFTDAVAGIGAVIAAERQRKLLHSASQDLSTAAEALLADLKAESEYATGVLQALAIERATVYGAYIQAGLVSAPRVLQPALADVAPGASIIAKPPAANQPAIASAAQDYVNVQTKQAAAQISQTYQGAIKTLSSVVAQQKQLSKQKPLDIQSIWTQIQQLQMLITDATSS